MKKAIITIILIGTIFFGMFFDWINGLVGAVFAVLFYIYCKKNNGFVIPKSLFHLIIVLLPIISLVIGFWSVDSGEAVFGFIKYFPVSIFVLLISQIDGEEKESIISKIPIMASAVTVIGLATYVTPLKELIFINGRFSGTFQYANAYALFLMISLFIALFSNDKQSNDNQKNIILINKSYINLVCVAICSLGIILTGCRAIFFLTVLGIISWLAYKFVKKQRINKAPLLIFASSVIFLLTIAIATGNTRSFARYTQLYKHSSSFMARLIYLKDGLSVLKSHPFGVGYNGFHILQGSVQTGNYYVLYVHNDLIQAALDFGIVVGVALLVGYIISVARKNVNPRNRMILLLVGVHALFDWGLQFNINLILIILLMENEPLIDVNISIKALKLGIIPLSAALIVSVWISSASLLNYLGLYREAYSIYPKYTDAAISIISNTANDSEKYYLAENLIKHNKYSTIAYQALAERAGRNSNFDEMIEYAKKAVSSSKYNTEGYEIYLYMLSYAIDEAQKANDEDKFKKYCDEVIALNELIKSVEKNSDSNAKYMYDKPEINLDKEYEQYIEEIINVTNLG